MIGLLFAKCFVVVGALSDLGSLGKLGWLQGKSESLVYALSSAILPLKKYAYSALIVKQNIPVILQTRANDIIAPGTKATQKILRGMCNCANVPSRLHVGP